MKKNLLVIAPLLVLANSSSAGASAVFIHPELINAPRLSYLLQTLNEFTPNLSIGIILLSISGILISVISKTVKSKNTNGLPRIFNYRRQASHSKKMVFPMPGIIKEKTKEVLFNNAVSEVYRIAGIGHWEMNLITNQCLWSDIAYDILEIEKGREIKIEDSVKLYHPDHHEIISSAIENTIANHEPWDMELKIITPDKKEKWVRVIGHPIVENGKLKKIQGLFQNIDKKKRSELKLENVRKDLEKRVKKRTSELRKTNHELVSFSYSLSHDLRAPLRAIDGYVEALMQDCKDQVDDKAARYIDRISANSEKMGQLIDDLIKNLD